MKQIRKICSLGVAAALFASCADPDYPTPVTSSDVRTANVMLINAVPDAPSALSFLVNNGDPSATLSFLATAKITVNTASMQFRVPNATFGVVGSDTISQKGDLTTFTSATALVGGGNGTLIVMDTINKPFGKGTAFTTNKGGLSFITFITENLAAIPAAGKSSIRFLNLAPGSSAVYLTAGGATLPGSLSSSAHAAKASSVTVNNVTTNFITLAAIPATTSNLEVRTGSATGPIIATLPAPGFTDGKIYTVFLSGKAVKIGSTTKVKVPYKINVVQHN